jgi:enoyl-CoA hydratase/carnithine racemase
MNDRVVSASAGAASSSDAAVSLISGAIPPDAVSRGVSPGAAGTGEPAFSVGTLAGSPPARAAVRAAEPGASAFILTETRDGILRIELNRPSKKNAITGAMYEALANALELAEQDAAVRAILITGKESIFTAGNDIEDFLLGVPPDENSPALQFLWQISHAGKPLVAAVCGAAIGVGTTMLLHCDLVYAGENASFSMPFTHLGLCPEAASSLLLPQIAGYQRAAEKLLLGESFDAQEAREMGFVNKVLPTGEVVAYAERQAAKLAELPSSSVRLTKRLMKAEATPAIEARMSLEAAQFLAMLDSPEAREAFTAFIQRRKPDFKQFS